jgi:hypothetical protein
MKINSKAAKNECGLEAADRDAAVSKWGPGTENIAVAVESNSEFEHEEEELSKLGSKVEVQILAKAPDHHAASTSKRLPPKASHNQAIRPVREACSVHFVW